MLVMPVFPGRSQGRFIIYLGISVRVVKRGDSLLTEILPNLLILVFKTFIRLTRAAMTCIELCVQSKN